MSIFCCINFSVAFTFTIYYDHQIPKAGSSIFFMMQGQYNRSCTGPAGSQDAAGMGSKIKTSDISPRLMPDEKEIHKPEKTILPARRA